MEVASTTESLATSATATDSVPTGGSSPGETSTGEGSTGAVDCEVLADCEAGASECRVAAACEGGACRYQDVDAGTPVAAQTPGDCTVLACDGAGGVAPVADASDVEDDGVLCTLDGCDGTTPTHTPGMTGCYSGPDGTLGVGQCAGGMQMCDGDGLPVGPCVGEVVPAAEDCDGALQDEDCDGEVNEDGAACVCVPGAVVPCYEGAPETLDVGACHGGSHVCAPDGLGFGDCVDQALPGVEDCDPADIDEDCDGHTNESGPGCACGDGDVSEGEVCDDGNNVDGDGCSADCQDKLVPVQVAVGQNHACARFNDGRVKCWGGNSAGRLGLGDVQNRGDQPGEMGAALPFVDLGNGVVATDIAAGAHHTCVRTAGGIKCWGENGSGQLGLGDTNDRGDQPGEMGNALPYTNVGGTPVQMSCGGEFTCVRFEGGSIKCWGWSLNGELGQGNTNSVGDNVGEMGANLKTVPIGVNAVQVDGGSSHVCARGAAGIKCWGGNNGELGVGHGENLGDMPGELGIGYIDLAPTKPVYVDAGGSIVCAHMDDKSVRCWGSQVLGLGDKQARGDDPGEMGVNLPPVDVGGVVAELFATGHGACVRLVDGTFKCWGNNGSGQLGLGDKNDRGDEPGEMGAALPAVDLGGAKVVSMSSDFVASCALLDDDTIKCWGSNSFGQLGLGDKLARGDEPGEMGVALPAVSLL